MSWIFPANFNCTFSGSPCSEFYEFSFHFAPELVASIKYDNSNQTTYIHDFLLFINPNSLNSIALTTRAHVHFLSPFLIYTYVSICYVTEGDRQHLMLKQSHVLQEKRICKSAQKWMKTDALLILLHCSQVDTGIQVQVKVLPRAHSHILSAHTAVCSHRGLPLAAAAPATCDLQEASVHLHREVLVWKPREQSQASKHTSWEALSEQKSCEPNYCFSSYGKCPVTTTNLFLHVLTSCFQNEFIQQIFNVVLTTHKTGNIQRNGFGSAPIDSPVW